MEKVKLNLGCGKYKKHGYINIDSNPQFEPDKVMDVRDLKEFKDNSVDEIYARDVLEHISHRHTEKTLKEWYRVLRMGGILKLQVPNFMTLAKEYVDIRTSDGTRIDILRRIFGGQDYPQNFHCNGFCDFTISMWLFKAGFKKMDIVSINDYETEGYKYNMTCEARK